ncbi:MAG: outer membrane beta-barrel protein [Proteobacteria bacterium]|nr:outer membrane beta-barrel protein [Pseudomonadota bacterium]
MERIQNIFSSCGRRLGTLLFAALACLAFTCAPTEEASAQGFELDAGIGWMANTWYGAAQHGFEITISPGYRIVDWVGVYLDQGFGGLFPGGEGFFAGQTIFNAKFYYELGPGELWGKFGLGAFYTGSHGESSGAFAFKIGIGYTADITEMIGIGGQFDYLPTMGGNGWASFCTHVIEFQFHVRFKF